MQKSPVAQSVRESESEFLVQTIYGDFARSSAAKERPSNTLWPPSALRCIAIPICFQIKRIVLEYPCSSFNYSRPPHLPHPDTKCSLVAPQVTRPILKHVPASIIQTRQSSGSSYEHVRPPLHPTTLRVTDAATQNTKRTTSENHEVRIKMGNCPALPCVLVGYEGTLQFGPCCISAAPTSQEGNSAKNHAIAKRCHLYPRHAR